MWTCENSVSESCWSLVARGQASATWIPRDWGHPVADQAQKRGGRWWEMLRLSHVKVWPHDVWLHRSTQPFACWKYPWHQGFWGTWHLSFFTIRMEASCSTTRAMNSMESASGTPWTTEGCTVCRRLQWLCIPKRLGVGSVGLPFFVGSCECKHRVFYELCAHVWIAVSRKKMK